MILMQNVIFEITKTLPDSFKNGADDEHVVKYRQENKDAIEYRV